MKSLHRTKAIAAYRGADLVVKEGQEYPAYVLLKEAVRGLLSYIEEDITEKEIADKTKLGKLLENMPNTLVQDEQKEILNKLVIAEAGGLSSITSMDIKDLQEIKTVTKKLISEHLKKNL